MCPSHTHKTYTGSGGGQPSRLRGEEGRERNRNCRTGSEHPPNTDIKTFWIYINNKNRSF